jgi:hypothetical protein
MLCCTASCSASRAVTHHVFCPVADYRPDNRGSSSRQHLTIYGIRGSTPGWHEPGALSLVTFYLFYALFLSLAEVLQFYSTYFAYPFVSYLRPTGRTVPSYLVLFTIKSHVHRTEKSSHYHPSELLRLRIRETCQNFVFRSRDFIYCRPLSPFVAFCLSRCLLRRNASRAIARHRSSSLLISSRRVKSDSLRNPLIYIYSLFYHLSLRLLKKGLTSSRSFHSFCRFIPLQVYQQPACQSQI